MLQGAVSSNIMPRARHWLRAVRRTFAKSSCRTVAVLNRTNLIHGMATDDVEATTPTTEVDDDRAKKEEPTVEDFAATRIQSYFRGHLARRAFRALRSLVKLQAAARGMFVRKQMRVAIHFMQAMVRLQVRVRARQLLRKPDDPQNSANYVTQ